MGNCLWGSKEEVSNPIINNPRGAIEAEKVEQERTDFNNFNQPDMMLNNVNGVGGGARVHGPLVGQIIKPDLKIYTFTELKLATRNFRPDSVLGEGRFGRVYKGWIDKTTLAPSKVGAGIPVAVKKCSADSAQGLKEWKTEINFLEKFSHPNLVKLIGYCWEDKKLLLVHEYLNKGSLENHLFQRRAYIYPSWTTRINIALDAARGLDFLHTSENTVIYRDFKAADILLDENFGAKLSDFSLARIEPMVDDYDEFDVTEAVVGTYNYAAPEYISAGYRIRHFGSRGKGKGIPIPKCLWWDLIAQPHDCHLYVSSDVYCFGVVLLEILTGFRAYDLNRPTGQTILVDWYKPMLREKSKMKKIIDPRMDDYPPEGANNLAQLISGCLQHDPKNRPPMSEVVIILERISTIRMNPKGSKPGSSKTKRPHSYHPSPAQRQNGLGGGCSPRPRPVTK